MRIVLMLAALLIASPVFAHDCCCGDGGMSKLSALTRRDIEEAIDSAAKRADDATSCERAELLGNLQNSMSLSDPQYDVFHKRYQEWSDRCHRFLDEEISRATWPLR